MRIGLISDTHIPSSGEAPPDEVIEAFRGVDLILHAGHAYTAQCIEWLERIAPVKSAESWLQGISESPMRTSTLQVFEFEGHRVGMTHELILKSLGDEVLPGAIDRYYPKNESIAQALEVIFGQPVDIVVFGYTHQAMLEEHDGVLLVNPGSPNLVRQEIGLGTVAILEVTPGARAAHIIDLATL
ncbi:MAG: metallophosphatase family protein [Dehalococcoidia bacterium]|nr:metallophosphatase family protein [Dehalococcoidia bacterium]HRC62024.1 metallophosphoesterase family protein [Dehalococcoidia bacterium]